MGDRLEKLWSDLRGIGERDGVEVGAADMRPARNYIAAMGGAFLASFPRAISLVLRLSDTVIDQLSNCSTPKERLTIYHTYHAHGTLVARTQLERVGLLMCNEIERSGFKAFPTVWGQVDEKNMMGAISHKIAANLAGLGWIGKNALLVTPKFGPRLRLATLLTDAPFNVGSPLGRDCGSCSECVDICPAEALTGEQFSEKRSREELCNPRACSEYSIKELAAISVKNLYAPAHICGLCLYICPFGRGGKKGMSEAAG